MPEALARADHDFILREDARPAKARRSNRPARERNENSNSLLRRLFRRPGRTFLLASGGLLLVGIGVNALFLQNARHPAPFFHARDSARAIDAAAAAVAPVPPVRPAEAVARPAARPVQAAAPAAERSTGAEGRAAAPVREAAREPARQNVAAPAALKPEPRSDAIAALLRDGRPNAPTPPGSIPNPTADQSRRIVAVQEALKKLGHGVTPDGVAGPATRVAIENFERTQKLPVTGQMSPKLLRELTTRSGVKIP